MLHFQATIKHTTVRDFQFSFVFTKYRFLSVFLTQLLAHFHTLQHQTYVEILYENELQQKEKEILITTTTTTMSRKLERICVASFFDVTEFS